MRSRSRGRPRRGTSSTRTSQLRAWPSKFSIRHWRAQISPIIALAALVALLEGHGLEELPDPEPAGVARRAAGREDVVRADRLVAVGDRRRLAEEERAVVPHPLEVPARVGGLDLDVLEGVRVGGGERLVVGVDDDDLAVVLPRPRRDLGGRQVSSCTAIWRSVSSRERLRRRDEDGRRGGAVLGLAEQVGGDDHRVGRLVGDDEDLRRAGDEVDADLPEQPALRLDDVRVARADEEVDRVDRLGSERERGERLNAAEDVDLVGAGEVHGGDGGVGHAPVERRRARRDALDARDLRRDDAHVRRGDHRVAAARHVGADVRRDVPVAEADARERLDLEVRHRRALGLGERPHLLLAERDVVEHLGRDALEARRDLVGVEPEGLRLPAVETGRVAPDGGVSVRRDGGDDLVDDLRDGLVVLCALVMCASAS